MREPERSSEERVARSDAVRPPTAGRAQAYVALGANLGDPLSQMRRAASRLSRFGAVTGRSSLYLTSPVGGPPDQPDYLNAVIRIEPIAALREPIELLSALLELEVELGRVRREKWGPRLIDLDLLAHGREVRREPGLLLPHPRLQERPFVLAPLTEVEPSWRHPLDGRLATEALASLLPSGLPRADLTW